MEARRTNFKQIDVTRACKGAVAGGLNVGRVEIDSDGKIIIVVQQSGQGSDVEINDWD